MIKIDPVKANEKLSKEVRNKRDELLKQTDYLLMPDYPNKPAGIESYRQALRDVTKQTGFPDDIVWPVKPDEVTA